MKILDRLPISMEGTSLRFGDRHVKARRNQIVVWVSVHLGQVVDPEANIPRFPALLDTGNNFGFSIQDRHLREWAGIARASLERIGGIEIDGDVVGRREAAVWLHPNVPGRQAAAVDGRPYRMRMSQGIVVYPPDADPPGPRLPLLGLPALLDSDLDLWLDPERRQATARSHTWRRSLVRLLQR